MMRCAEKYLKDHADPAAIEFYLCGPPAMVRAAAKMLDELGVPHAKSPSTNFDMKLKLVRHLWGVDQQRGLEPFLPRWREVGYEALEVSWRYVTDQEAFLRISRSEPVRLDTPDLHK